MFSVLPSGSSQGISGLYSFPPNASISFLTATNHSFISSGLSKTSKRLDTARRMSARRPPIFLNIDLDISVSTEPSSFKACETCKTKGFPGIASEAKAADNSLSCKIFSGSRSYVPWPAYCSKYPAVTSTYVLSTHSPLAMMSNAVCFLSLFSFCIFPSMLPLRSPWLMVLLSFETFFSLLRRKIASADIKGAFNVECLTDCGYTWNSGGAFHVLTGTGVGSGSLDSLFVSHLNECRFRSLPLDD